MKRTSKSKLTIKDLRIYYDISERTAKRRIKLMKKELNKSLLTISDLARYDLEPSELVLDILRYCTL